jgi:hypothetical protein
MLGEFGVPQRGVAVLIGAELAIAVTLAVPVTHRVGALAALAALAVFSAAIAVQLAHGRHPTCRCFGTLRPSRVGASTLARNALLAALAACVAAGGAAIAGFLAVAATAAICWAILEGRRLRPDRVRRTSPRWRTRLRPGAPSCSSSARRRASPARRWRPSWRGGAPSART